AEVVFVKLMRRHGITGWTPNARISLAGYGPAVVDVWFAAARLVVEIDGWAAHNSQEAFQKDRTRQNALVAAGLRVLRFTWHDLTKRPDYVADRIQSLLASTPSC
ncbi:MAG: endonuclease domain-containing protein, partial [Bifidobacteriaceae bacterium]|nr:endonuclease domain-containing protein [Bifidobacteriaceae bacterium]